MATHYTQFLIDNPNMPLKEWAFHCARAFGVCASMRDEDSSLPAPRKFKPDLKYHKSELRSAKKALAKLKKMTKKQRVAYNKKRTEEQRKYYKEILAEEQATQAKFSKMKEAVINWNAPATHDEFKKFMLDQLEISTTNTSYYENFLTMVDNCDYWKKEIELTKSNIQYHINGQVKEIESVKKRNEWIEGLYKSFSKK